MYKLVLILLVYLAYRWIKSKIQQSLASNAGRRESDYDEGSSKGGRQRADDIMIEDPYCKVYFPKREGVLHRSGGKDIYFCSKECRDAYIDQNEN